MIVRPATAADAPALTDLINEIIAIGGTTAHETPFTPEVFAEHYICGPGAICCHLAAEAAGAALGFQSLDLYPGLGAGWADIGTFVRPAARGTGAGPALFAATCAAARARGIATLNATIRADNALGLAYYSRMGFQDYGRDPDYRLKDGRRVGRISKRYDLVSGT